MAKRKDLDLDDEPELINTEEVTSALGKQGRKILRLHDELINTTETLHEKIKAAKKEMVELMLKEDKKSIVIDGHIFSHRHKEAVDDVAIRKKAKKKDEETEE